MVSDNIYSMVGREETTFGSRIRYTSTQFGVERHWTLIFSTSWSEGVDMKLFPLLLVFDAFFSNVPVQSQTVSPGGAKSFTSCTVADGQPVCASDAPNTTITLNRQNLNTALCPDVLCAWQCRTDPQCLEFNVHSRTWTCDLYYNQPMEYQHTTDCRHFQVRSGIFSKFLNAIIWCRFPKTPTILTHKCLIFFKFVFVLPSRFWDARHEWVKDILNIV